MTELSASKQFKYEQMMRLVENASSEQKTEIIAELLKTYFSQMETLEKVNVSDDVINYLKQK